MATYMIGYDLHEGEDYEDLIAAIKKIGSKWLHNLDSTWFVVSDKTPLEIGEALHTHLMDGDRLVVALMCKETATFGLSDRDHKWLDDNL